MRVLFATDGSAPARAAGALIQQLFDPDRVAVDVLSVAAPPNFDPLAPDLSAEWARLDLPVLDAEHIAAEAGDALSERGFSTTSYSMQGSTAHEIVRAAERGGHGLIVLGGSHTTWLGNTLLGSVSIDVLHHASTSVLIVHRAPMPSGRVLIGVDGSLASTLAVSAALNVLDKDRCSIEIACAVRPVLSSAGTHPVPVPIPRGALVAEMDQVVEERARVTAEREAERARSRGFRTESVVLIGSPASQLLKETENLAADLVVVGSRDLSAVGRIFLGSVSDPIVRHAPATLITRGRSPVRR